MASFVESARPGSFSQAQLLTVAFSKRNRENCCSFLALTKGTENPQRQSSCPHKQERGKPLVLLPGGTELQIALLPSPQGPLEPFCLVQLELSGFRGFSVHDHVPFNLQLGSRRVLSLGNILEKICKYIFHELDKVRWTHVIGKNIFSLQTLC